MWLWYHEIHQRAELFCLTLFSPRPNHSLCDVSPGTGKDPKILNYYSLNIRSQLWINISVWREHVPHNWYVGKSGETKRILEEPTAFYELGNITRPITKLRLSFIQLLLIYLIRTINERELNRRRLVESSQDKVIRFNSTLSIKPEPDIFPLEY